MKHDTMIHDTDVTCRAEESVRSLLELAESCGKLLIFSGSGLSANSGKVKWGLVTG